MKFTLHFLFFEKNDRLKSQDTFLKALEMLDKIQKKEIQKVICYPLRFGSGKTEPENKPHKQHCSRKYEIVYGVYPNWNKYGAEELRQMAAEIIRAGK